MCYKLESGFILVHSLKRTTHCTITELVNKKSIIEKEFPSVFVDVSKSSVLNSVFSFPEIFSWDNEKVQKSLDSADFYEKPLINYFNPEIDSVLTDRIINILEDAV